MNDLVLPTCSTRTVASPVGPLALAVDRNGRLVRLGFGAVEDRDPDDRTAPIVRQLAEYFRGERRHFDVEVDLEVGGTPFQRRVWRTLLEIPYGATWSYRDLAERVDSVPRAVGGANGANPIAIVVPCHRVINAGGGLGGYGGGLDAKVLLLRLEGAWI